MDGISHGTEVVLRDLFLYRQTGVAPDGTILGHFAATGQVPSFLEEVTVNGIDLDAAIFASPAQTNGS